MSHVDSVHFLFIHWRAILLAVFVSLLYCTNWLKAVQTNLLCHKMRKSSRFPQPPSQCLKIKIPESFLLPGRHPERSQRQARFHEEKVDSNLIDERVIVSFNDVGWLVLHGVSLKRQTAHERHDENSWLAWSRGVVGGADPKCSFVYAWKQHNMACCKAHAYRIPCT